MNKIKRLRILNDCTQKEIAEYLEIKQNTYSLKERGDKKFTLEEGLKLAKYYNLTVEELFGC